MQSFKQFLLKEDNYNKDIRFYLTFPGIDVKLDEAGLSEQIEQKLKEHQSRLNIKQIDLVACWMPEVHISVIISKNEVIDKKHLANEIYTIVREFTPCDRPLSEIVLFEMPEENEVIEWDDIILNLSNYKYKSVSFHNIHKKIKCDTLTINFIGDKVSDSVLGLLMFKHLKFYNNSQSDLWIPIIKKYFNSSKDILDCQEELIENGLKEYAKL